MSIGCVYQIEGLGLSATFLTNIKPIARHEEPTSPTSDAPRSVPGIFHFF